MLLQIRKKYCMQKELNAKSDAGIKPDKNIQQALLGKIFPYYVQITTISVSNDFDITSLIDDKVYWLSTKTEIA